MDVIKSGSIELTREKIKWKIVNYIKMIRIKHWIKNLLVFFPLIFSKSIFNVETSIQTIMAFISFSLVASVIYIINDIFDCEKDRLHPTKCKRPIASGVISVKEAVICAGILSFFCFILCCIQDNKASCYYIIIFSIINIIYSRGLKNYPVIDVTILATGFLLRVFYGASVSGIEISSWLYLTVMSFAFFFGLGKRRNELFQLGYTETRKVLKFYNKDFLDKSMYMCVTIGVVFYSLWTMEREDNNLTWTVPIIIIIIMKYIMDIEGETDGDPIEVLMNDRWLIIMCCIYLGLVMMFIYLL